MNSVCNAIRRFKRLSNKNTDTAKITESSQYSKFAVNAMHCYTKIQTGQTPGLSFRLVSSCIFLDQTEMIRLNSQALLSIHCKTAGLKTTVLFLTIFCFGSARRQRSQRKDFSPLAKRGVSLYGPRCRQGPGSRTSTACFCRSLNSLDTRSHTCENKNKIHSLALRQSSLVLRCSTSGLTQTRHKWPDQTRASPRMLWS